MRANSAKLKYTGKTAEDDVIFNVYMTGKRSIIGKYHVIANDAVVRDVHVRHQ